MINNLREFISKCEDFNRVISGFEILNMNDGINEPEEYDVNSPEWRSFKNRAKTFFEVNDYPAKMVEYGQKYNEILARNGSGNIIRKTVNDLIVLFNDAIDYLEFSEDKSTKNAPGKSPEKIKNKEKKIFISHNSYDEKYCKALVLFLHQLGITRANIVCTSLDGYGPAVDDDIYLWLRKQFDYDLHVLFILSKAYYNSTPSLNEMGAAWVLQQKYTTFMLPGFCFNMIKGTVNPQKIAIELKQTEHSLKSRMKQFSKNICSEFGLTMPDDDQWNLFADSFIETIKNANASYMPDGYKGDIEDSISYKAGISENFKKADSLNDLPGVEEIMMLGKPALVLLAFASKDPQAQIEEYRDVRGHHIVTDGYDYIRSTDDAKMEAIWVDAFDKIVKYDYVVKISRRDTIYKLSSKGFSAAEIIIDKGVVNIKNTPDVYLDELWHEEADRLAKTDVYYSVEAIIREENGIITVRQISEKCGIAPTTIRRIILILVNEGKIERVGDNRNVGYRWKA